ncbi:MAG: hypothetical protein EBS05_11945 [Proteobacteria bacterium]|nr:hypothetical protein [Pseudomonadota bacterium]
MNIPRFWAEARAQHRERGKQVTVRRFGWSATSESEAQANAQARADEALERLLAGEKLDRREPKVAYNGAEGVPIREEIIAEHGTDVITRNSYGALCLNTPDVLFADIDFSTSVPDKLGCIFCMVLILVSAELAWKIGSWRCFFFLSAISGVIGWLIASGVHKAYLALNGGSERLAIKRISEFIATQPAWRLRLYRTPAGLRLLAMHRVFAPEEPAVKVFFNAIRADPVYVTMCQRQKCFRARVSPKPWRIGIGRHLKPRPGIWPVRSEAVPAREAWVKAYHEKACGFAACRLVSEMGNGKVDDRARDVQHLHDQLCRAETDLPIA